MPCVSLIVAPNLRSPRAGRGVLKSMSELQALEQSSVLIGGRILKKRNLVFPTVLKQQLIFTSFRGKFVEHPCVSSFFFFRGSLLKNL